MAVAFVLVALLSSAALHSAHADTAATTASPIGKVLQLLSDLEGKIIGEGGAAQKVYSEFSEWCEERSKNLGFEIKTGKDEKADLEATIAEETALSASLTSKIEALAASIATDEADVKAAGEIRDKEAADFAASSKELSETIDMLEHAIGLLEKHASMLQVKNAGSIAEALTVLVQASAISSADAVHLTALVQSSQKSQAGDEEGDVGAPAGEVYVSHSGNIVATLQDLLEQAEDQLSSARKTENTDIRNYQLLKQSLDDELKVGNQEMAEAKKGLAGSGEKKAAAEGDLAETRKGLDSDSTALADLHELCMKTAQDYEAETKSRGEELKALADAKKAIADNTASADELSYGLSQVSLLQEGRVGLTSRADLAKFEAVRFVRNLAQKQHSSALAQLAARMATAAKSRSAEDPFAKVKGLITDMIEKLESEAEEDATHKAFCDKELAETNEKKADKTVEIEKLSTQIDGMMARSAQLKSEVGALQKALSELASAQAEMDKLRKEENAAFVTNKADMEQGLEGVKLALKVLNEYYAKDDKAHAVATGAGSGIIGLLEVIESDFSKGLAEMIATEETAQADYEKETEENEIEKTTKVQDVKYKTQEFIGLDKAIAEDSSDRAGVQTELDAVMEYLASLHKQCTTTGGVLGTEGAEGESFETRQQRRQTEIAGLKQALEILDGEAALIQQSRSSKRSLRAVQAHRGAM